MKAKIKKNIIVKYKWLCGFACLVIGLIACHPRTERPTLERAEAWMDSHPDSAQQLLEAIPQPERLSKEEYATWCLLVTQAHDKNYVVHTSDSIIDVAVRYFGERGEPQLYSKALYYKGRIWQDLGETEKATALFVRALDVGEQATDYPQLFLIASRLGTLYGYQDLAKQALASYRKAYDYAVLSKDSSSLSYANSYLGRAYGMQQDWEKAIAAYRKGEEIATAIQDEEALALALSECADIYEQIGCFDKAKLNYDQIYQTLENSVKEKTKYYLKMGDLYRLMNQYDSAAFYLYKALAYENVYTRQAVYQCFYFLYEEQGNYLEAIQYNNLYWALTDSIQQSCDREIIAEIKARYNYEKIENKNTQLVLERERMVRYVGMLLFGCLFFVVVYQKRLLKKNKELLEMRETLDLQLIEMEKNEKQMVSNQNKIDYLAYQLEEKEKQWKNQVVEQEEAKKRLVSENEEIKQKNEKLKVSIQKKLVLLRQQNEEFLLYKNRMEAKVRYTNILIRLKKEKWTLLSEDWDELYLMLNTFSDDFVNRLVKTFPQLSENDVRICCLIRINYPLTDMIELLQVQEEAIIKRKQRIRNHMDRCKKWKKGELDTFIRSF